jgi:hypothetical protein
MFATALTIRNAEEPAMPSHRTVRVPPAQAAAVVNAVISAYARKAGALAEATRAYVAGREPLASIVEARREVIEAEATLDTLGWEPGPRGREVELTGPAGAVREVVYDALVAAAGTARAACREYERALIDRAQLAAAVANVTALHELFDRIEAADHAAPGG